MTPLPVLAHDELRAIETRAAREPGPTLMERAGRAAAECARRLATDSGRPILVVAGPGNNGGDAWVAAAHLTESFHRVVVFDVAGGKPRAVEAQAAQSASSRARARSCPSGRRASARRSSSTGFSASASRVPVTARSRRRSAT
jgi:NAD(P)H-hydrate repair Nnr-like enzyme with NAD(P)H-hydrate epimerase domain